MILTVPFQPEEFSRGLATLVLGRAVHYMPAVDSTNALARSLAEEGAADGTLVVTDYQSAGRGRLDRIWIAPVATGLLFSLILRPPLPPERMAGVTMAAGLGCAAGIARACGLNARLKWPNDITLDGRKAGGMLGEFTLRGDALDYVIVGIGLNVNFDPAGVEGIPPGATSLMAAAGDTLPREPLLCAILGEIEPRYRAVCGGESVRAEWAAALETLGRRIRVATHTGSVEGLAEDVGEDGGLILRLDDGARRTVHAGDAVQVRGA